MQSSSVLFYGINKNLPVEAILLREVTIILFYFGPGARRYRFNIEKCKNKINQTIIL